MSKLWCILRCKGSSTLRLARSLHDEGYEAWSPIEVQIRRDRLTSKRNEIMVAVMPTYVFIPEDHLITMIRESAAPVSHHPDFSVFRYCDRFPLIADSELTALRHIEKKAAAKAMPVRFGSGEPVRTPDGPFQGMTGQVVETSGGKFTLVAFPGLNIPIKFASWKLEKAA